MIRRIVREIRRRLPGNAGISRAVPWRAAALGLVRFDPAPGGAADLRLRDGSRVPRLLRLEPQWLRRGDRRLLARPLRRILVFRRNRLQAAVSERISMQTWTSAQAWIWQRNQGKIERPLEPLEPEDLARRMEWLREDSEQYRRFLAENDLDFHEVAYEDLFGPDVAPAARIARVREIFAHLGAAEPDAAAWRRIAEHLDPARNKLNSEVTYRLIPNALAIEARLGGEDAGHLFETRRSESPPSAN